MNSFNKFIELSKKIASLLLKEKEPTNLQDSELFNNEDKEYIHKNITDKDLIKERNKLSDQINIEEDWKIVKNKITIPVKKLVFWKYAAAAIFIGGLVSIPFLTKKISKTTPTTEVTTVVADKDIIVIGSDKATLTLEDGSNIELEKGKTLNTTSIKSNGEKLVYKKSKKKELKYNYLTIPRGGEYFVELSDGTEVWLNSESQLKFPVAFIAGKVRQVELVYGEAYFSVSPSSNHNGDKFKVLNLGQEVEVLGTEFNIKAYKDESHIYTTLIEGKVTISNALSTKQTLLPNQQSILNIKNNNIKITQVDVKTEISWKNGLFSFKGKNLKSIMKVISRWYDIDVVFKNKSLEKVKFKGVLGKNQNIEEILSSIKTLSIIKGYEIDGKTITLN